jgi:hypothetical protein
VNREKVMRIPSAIEREGFWDKKYHSKFSPYADNCIGLTQRMVLILVEMWSALYHDNIYL